MKRIIIIGSLAVAFASKTMAVEFSEVQIAGKRITVCRVDVRKAPLQLFLRDDNAPIHAAP